MSGSGKKTLKDYERAAGVASEAISGIRTVAAFSREKRIEEQYNGTMSEDLRGVMKREAVTGAGQGIALFSMYFLYFCGYAGGAYLIRTQGYAFDDVMQVSCVRFHFLLFFGFAVCVYLHSFCKNACRQMFA